MQSYAASSANGAPLHYQNAAGPGARAVTSPQQQQQRSIGGAGGSSSRSRHNKNVSLSDMGSMTGPSSSNNATGANDFSTDNNDNDNDAAATAGVAGEELPFNVPLSHELFLNNAFDTLGEFDASAFLLTRKHTSLDDLRSELRTYLATLRAQLVSIINSDYEDFINLGGSHLLGSEDQMSLRMRKPLEGISHEIKDCKSSLQDIRENLRIKLRRRELVRERKIVCRKLLSVNDQVSKVEEMLLITPAGTASSATAGNSKQDGGADRPYLEEGLPTLSAPNALNNRSHVRRVSPAMMKKVDRSMGSDTKRLERVAQEYNQLLYLVRKSEGLKFVESLQPRIDRISATLSQDLASLLSSTLTSLQSTSTAVTSATSTTVPSSSSTTSKQSHIIDYKSKLEALSDLFRTYASINKYREAEEVVRKLVVSDFISKTIQREALLGPQSPMMPITPFSGGGSAGLASSSVFGSLGQAFSHVTSPGPSLSSPGGAYPFPPAAATTQGSGSTAAAAAATTTLTHEDRSLIPHFYLVDPVQAPIAAPNADTYISDALIDLYNKLLTFISKELGFILDITERKPTLGRSATAIITANGSTTDLNLASSGFLDKDVAQDRTIPGSPSTRERALYNANAGKPGYEILSNVVFTEIVTRLMSECGHLIFAAGRPDSFHRNYLTTLSFINRLESLCPNIKYLQVLRNNPNYTAFTKRWQLPVYFQLRFKDVIGQLEGSLSAHTIAAAPTAIQSTSLIMAASEQIYKSITACWSDEIFLLDLSGRFWKLTLQIISRYKTWLDSRLPDYVVKDAIASTSAATSNSTAGTGGTTGLNFQRLLPNNPLSSSTSSSRPTTPQPNATSADDSSDDSTLRQLSIVISDTQKLESMILRFFEGTISQKLPKLTGGTVMPGESDEETPEAALRLALSSITSLSPSLLAQLAVILSKRCAEPLRLVRSGASQVRANTGKGGKGWTPEPSYFVPNILRPARNFLDGPGKVLPDEMKRSTMQTLFEDLAGRYEAALSKMKKDGDALRRLKKGRQGFQLFGRSTSSASANEETVSAEDEKVKLQMRTDIEAFAAEAESLGVDLDASETLKTLKTVVDEWTK